MRRPLRIGDRSQEVEVERIGPGRFRVRIGDRVRELGADSLGDGRLRLVAPEGAVEVVLTRGDREIFVTLPGSDHRVELETARRRAAHGAHAAGAEVSLPMPGRVVKLHVHEGDRVHKGQPLVVIEAMKMEHTLKAPRDGAVLRLTAREGEMVEAGVALMDVE